MIGLLHRLAPTYRLLMAVDSCWLLAVALILKLLGTGHGSWRIPGELMSTVTGAPRSFVGQSHDLARVASAQLYFCFAVSRHVSAVLFFHVFLLKRHVSGVVFHDVLCRVGYRRFPGGRFPILERRAWHVSCGLRGFEVYQWWYYLTDIKIHFDVPCRENVVMSNVLHDLTSYPVVN